MFYKAIKNKNQFWIWKLFVNHYKFWAEKKVVQIKNISSQNTNRNRKIPGYSPGKPHLLQVHFGSGRRWDPLFTSLYGDKRDWQGYLSIVGSSLFKIHMSLHLSSKFWKFWHSDVKYVVKISLCMVCMASTMK
jgi:hypothetical protein